MKNIRTAKIMNRVAARLSAAALLAVLAGTLHADDWVYDNGTMTDGTWTFNAQRNGTKLTLTALTDGPSTLTALDFTKPIKDTSDNALSIGYFGRLFESPGDKNLKPYIGELTLPASGYTGFARTAFNNCANATGTITLAPELNFIEGNDGAFNGCSGITIVGDSFPEGLKEIAGNAFKGCKIQGDLVLTHLKRLVGGAFANTDVGSVTFGPDLYEIFNRPGGSTTGAFAGCTSLTNVVFDPASSVTNKFGLLFFNCTSLKEVDLSAFVHIEQENDDNSLFYFCNALEKVTFGSKLDYLDGRIFNHNSSISKVFFKGPPPATLANTYLLGVGNREVTTYVILDENATDYDYATAKAAWDALTAGGEINAVDSTWKADYIGDAPASTRHLLLYEIEHVSIEAVRDADEGEGVIGTFTVSRGAGESVTGPLVVNYTVGGTALGGQTYGALSGSVTIPAGATSTTIEIVPLDDPATTSNTTVVVTLSDGDYEIVAGHETATVNVINGASFPGWKYTITGNNSGTMSKGGWTFAATHSGRDLTVGAVTAYPAEVAPLDFSTCVAGSDGAGYTIVNLNITQLGANSESAATPESGSRVGLLTLPGEGLTTIGAWAFMSCTNAYGSLVFPSTLTKIGGGAFGKTKVSGDLTFPSLERMNAVTFMKTEITSVTFGPSFTGLWGGWDRGPFYGCASLTNVVFDPASKITLGYQGFIFRHCTALRDLDLSCVTNIAYENCGSNFDGCTSLTNITFGAGLTELPANTFANASALQSIHFKGAAPKIVGGSVENGGLFKDVRSSQTITTYVSVKYADVKNSAKLSWNDYVEGGMLGKSSTHWKTNYLYSSAGDGTRFPLLRIDGSALIIYVR